MDITSAKQLETLTQRLSLKIGPRRASMRLEVGVYDLVQEVLLKAVKRGLNEVEEADLDYMAEDVLKDAYRRQKNAFKAEQAYASWGEGPEDRLWEKLEEALEGRSWEEQRLVRLLRAGHSLKEAAETCGLSSWQARKRLLSLRNSVT